MFRKAKRDLTIEEQLARGPIDLPFLTLVVLLTLVGLVMLLSASYPSAYYNLDASIDTGGNPYYYFQRQLAFAVAGLVAMFIVSKIDYQRFRWMSVLALGVSVILLLLVFTPLGRSGGGARRWIQIGVRFQPSEVAKIGIILFITGFFSRHPKWITNFRKGVLPVLVVAGIYGGLIMAQPNMSTAVTVCMIAGGMLLVAGIPWKYVGILLPTAIVGGGLLMH